MKKPPDALLANSGRLAFDFGRCAGRRTDADHQTVTQVYIKHIYMNEVAEIFYGKCIDCHNSAMMEIKLSPGPGTK